MKEKYEKLVDQEQELQAVLREDKEGGMDRAEELLEAQGTVIEEIKQDPDREQEFQEQHPEKHQELVETFARLREQTNALMEKLKKGIEQQLQSVEKSKSISNKYYQGGKRDEEENPGQFHDLA